MKRIELSENLNFIEDHCFEGCSSLRELKTTNKLLKIGNDCFSGCYQIDNLFSESKEEFKTQFVDEKCKENKEIGMNENIIKYKKLQR